MNIGQNAIDNIYIGANAVDKVYQGSTQVFPPIKTFYDYVISTGPLMYWRLGELTGETIVINETGLFSGLYVNAPTLQQPSLLIGDADFSVTFDGLQDSVLLNNSLATLQTKSTGSISFIIVLDVGQRGGFYMNDNTLNDYYFIADVTETGGRFIFNKSQPSGVDNFSIKTVANLTAGIKYHITIVQDASAGALIYIDGVLAPANVTGGAPGDRWWSDLPDLNIVALNSLNITSPIHYANNLDEVILWDKKLSASEVFIMYEKSIGIGI